MCERCFLERDYYKRQEDMRRYYDYKVMNYISLSMNENDVIKKQETKKPMKKLNNMMKKLLDKDTQVLVKAELINGDLELTQKGKDSLMSIVFDTYKKELVKLAEEELAEAEKTK